MKKLFLITIALVICSLSNAATMSNRGKEFVKKHETCKLTSYWDANGYSIGYGHHKKNIKKGMKISKRQADIYFNQDIKESEKYATMLLNQLPYKYTFNQSIIDGLIDLVYNAGVGGAKNSPFYKRLKKCRISNGKINKQDLNYSIAAYKSSCISAPGHKVRRTAMYNMMLK